MYLDIDNEAHECKKPNIYRNKYKCNNYIK